MTELYNHLMHEFTLPLKNPVLVFSLILFIILLSPIVLRKLNIPGIIGLIISGVVIGPHGLNILEKNSAVTLFSTIGLLYIMFIAGLELDMNDFKANRNKSLLFGLFTFILPLAIGFPVCYYLLEYDLNASLLTASMFSTHTLVAYPIVSKFGIAKNQAVAVTVGGTVLTDTAVLIMLAVIMGNTRGTLDNEFWIKLTTSIALFSIVMFLIIPRIAKWFFNKLESEKQSHYIFVLSVVFFSSFLAEVAGLEAIIGAFAAGLALNKLIPHSSALMNRIEFIGNALFIPFFLISVGMIVNINVVLSGPTALIVAGILSVVAIFGKWVAASITQIAFKYSSTQRQLIFGLSSAHAAATLAVIMVGYTAGIIDENILNGIIILILITCVVASFATERAAKKLIIESEGEVAPPIKSNLNFAEHILLPVANAKNIEKLLEFSIYIKEKKSANPISVLSVVSNNNEAESNIIKAKNNLDELVKQASATETKVNTITTIDHNAASGISRISREIMANIIILGWPKRSNIIDKLLGEKIDNILAYSDKTIFVCQLIRPLQSLKEIHVAVPPLAEHESGFRQWLVKVTKLAQELSISISFICNELTEKHIQVLIKKEKISAAFKVSRFTDWEDFLILAKNIREDDLFVLVSARRGAASHMNILESLPEKMEKHFASVNKIIIYPQQYNQHYIGDSFEDVSGEPLSRGLEALQKIGKEIGGIFKHQDQKE